MNNHTMTHTYVKKGLSCRRTFKGAGVMKLSKLIIIKSHDLYVRTCFMFSKNLFSFAGAFHRLYWSF